MQLSLRLTSGIAKFSFWLAEHPRAVRVALIVLPLAIALIAAAFAPLTAYAGDCPLGSGGSGCGG